MKLFRGPVALIAVLAAGTAVSTCWLGCKENSAPTASSEQTLPRAVLHATPTPQDPLTADPLSSPLWKTASWVHLSPPLHEARTTPPTRAAALYGASNLYVALACNEPATGGAAGAAGQETVEIWLDTSAAQNGTDVLAVRVGADNQASCTWYRAVAPPQPKEDGSPNFMHPIREAPNYLVPGLRVAEGRGMWEGQACRTVVVDIPLGALPLPLRVEPVKVREGVRWKINIVRQASGSGGAAGDVAQAHLSPIVPASQKVAPYRMATLVLAGANPLARGR